MIKNMPEFEKPREKAFVFGTEALSNSELLALIIRCGTKDHSAIEIAKDVLQQCGGIGKMSGCSIYELMKVQGISKVKAIELSAIFELSRRIAFEKLQNKDVIMNIEDFISWLKQKIGFSQKEKFIVVYLDTANQIISYDVLFQGTLDMTAVYIREVMRESLLKGARSILLAHNHPSQNIEPSSFDLLITKKLVHAGEIIGVEVLDHIIVSGHHSYSIMHTGKIDA